MVFKVSFEGWTDRSSVNVILVPAVDFQIMREVYKALQRPEQVRRSAFDFIHKYIPSGRYLAVHWRFEGSLMEGGKTQSICKTKTNVRCQKIMNLYASPDLIVRKIRKQLAFWELNVSRRYFRPAKWSLPIFRMFISLRHQQRVDFFLYWKKNFHFTESMFSLVLIYHVTWTIATD